MEETLRKMKCVGCVLILLFALPRSGLTQDWVYTVIEGDNLWNLSELHLDKVTRFEQLRKLNHIQNPKRLQPGTQIRIPLKWIRSNPVPAQVHSIVGTAKIRQADKALWQGLQQGMKLYLGDEIRTDTNTTTAILFADKSILTIHENTHIAFDHLSAHGVTGMVDTRLNLLQGRMDTKVKPAVGPGSRFEIETPSAISGVRGTVYRASVAEDGETSNIEVLEGKVVVGAVSKQRLIPAGYGTQISMGNPPLPPRPLLVAPSFIEMPERIEHINSKVSWSTVQRASGYRVEISEQASFDSVLWQQQSRSNVSFLPDIADGQYHLRVRAIDDLGIEGLNRDKQIQLNVYPQPPIALTPVNGQVLRGQAPILRWTDNEQAQHYRLEIAADAGFRQRIVDRVVLDDTRYTFPSVPEKAIYYWRLSSIDSKGDQGPSGVARSYQIKAIPAQINASVAAKDNGQFIATWPVTAPKQRYQVQLSKNKTFSDLINEQTVSEPEFAFDPVKRTKRYLRVRSIEEDGYEGPWGTTQTIMPLPEEPNHRPLVIWTIYMAILIL